MLKLRNVLSNYDSRSNIFYVLLKKSHLLLYHTFFVVHNYVYILGACGPGAHNKRNKRNENNYTKEILQKHTGNETENTHPLSRIPFILASPPFVHLLRDCSVNIKITKSKQRKLWVQDQQESPRNQGQREVYLEKRILA